MSGDSSRDFSQVMLDFGVAIVGPGDPGPINTEKQYYIENGEWPKLSWLENAEVGDRIVMHSGQSLIQAVGEIKLTNNSIYQYSNYFEDIDGLDLQHFCFVNWRDLRISLDGRPLSRSTAQQLHKKDVINKIEEHWLNSKPINRKYEISEIERNDLSNDEIEQHLIDIGLRIEDAENTTTTISRVEKLAKWYLKQGEVFSSSEHEIRSFVVVPLLYALGWSHQKMAVEYDKMDILLFGDAGRKYPKILIETKSMWSGSANGLTQAINYLKTKEAKLRGLEKVIITDGLTYWLYNSNNMTIPIAYMSIKKRKKINPAYPHVGGFLDFIREIIPG